MATTLYLRGTTPAEPKPNVKQSSTSITNYITSILGGGQDDGTTIYPLDMLLSSATSDEYIEQVKVENGAPYYAWYKAFISPALSGAQTISGTITLVADFNEGNSNHNLMPRIYAYVWKGDDSGVRGELLANTDSIVESDTTSGSLQTFFNAVSLTGVNALDGDRIVIEIMSYDNNTKTVSYNHFLEMSVLVSGTRYDSYAQFSQTINFQTPPSGAIENLRSTFTHDLLFQHRLIRCKTIEII